MKQWPLFELCVRWFGEADWWWGWPRVPPAKKEWVGTGKPDVDSPLGARIRSLMILLLIWVGLPNVRRERHALLFKWKLPVQAGKPVNSCASALFHLPLTLGKAFFCVNESPNCFPQRMH